MALSKFALLLWILLFRLTLKSEVAEVSPFDRDAFIDRVRGELSKTSVNGRHIMGLPDDRLTIIASNLPSLPVVIQGVRAFRFDTTELIGSAFESGTRLFLPADDSAGQGKPFSFLDVVDRRGFRRVELRGGAPYGDVSFVHVSPTNATIMAEDFRAGGATDYFLIEDGNVFKIAAPPSGTTQQSSKGSGLTCVRSQVRSDLVIRDAATGLARTRVSYEELYRATNGAIANPEVFVGCRAVGSAVVMWFGTGGDGTNGVTYRVSASGLVPLAAGYPIASTAHFALFYNGRDRSRGTGTLHYAVFEN